MHLNESLDVNIGFHGHNNLSLAMANTIAAIKAGATRIDGSVRCLGAGAGNTQTEVLIAVCERIGIKTGVDLFKIDGCCRRHCCTNPSSTTRNH